MKVYPCVDLKKRLFFRVEQALTKEQIADWIAYDTDKEGNRIVRKSVRDEEGGYIKTEIIKKKWTKIAIEIEIKRTAKAFGFSAEGIEPDSEEQYKQALKIVEKFFPELGD